MKPNLIFLDTETTGVDFKKDYITELAFINGTYQFDEFISIPDEAEYPEEVQKLTNIPRAVLRSLGQKESFVSRFLYDILVKNPNTIFVAHNAQFDANMVKSMLERNGYEMPKIHYIDTLTIARCELPSPHKLKNCIEFYNLTGVKNSHRAIDDTKALKAVFTAMVSSGIKINNYVDKFAYNSYYGISGDKIEGVEYIEL